MGRGPSNPDDGSGTAASDSAASLRAYGGEGGDTRVARRRASLIDAALDLLGADDAEAVTVRGVCRRAGLTARYFYESFESVDQLVEVVYDEVIEEIAHSGLAAFSEGATMRTKVSGAVAAIVDLIDQDRRKGRLLFSQALLSPVIAAKRMESTALFAGLTLQSASSVLDVHVGPAQATGVAHYQVGGLSRLLAAWLEGDVELSKSDVVDLSIALLVSPAEILEKSLSHGSADGE
ncbi:TetR/AcrR family transcriptional regulator [Gordonia rubripertincta]|uniref:TetR/AcrR family transcriptional regulator n=2 Tax=Gordonia rubripertincta TaxID=36822 RepID=A0AAW6RCX7_GORRU|nr:TetR/AcrR family transcriptional regulator [Gordonia rubripertincta]MBM7276426.1 TetR/AcrR family transcriptional regulator [Gordonia rubripertincta]MDG6782240.1 TetR/AcrR family transcriptional regulator [Gordonia rubripertincta]NKY65022.1 TetR/AcrR family transcriptional regulator [Gordonia rubripertincta]QMU21538.1 TetR/AcrR family transcriptional regulator [Gordonia rubripertincta]GAB84774.1 putative TetR family transcriptional regulator [Gordonia rubripertincta NBRC 101908]